jgi:hypothetical protein
MAVLGKMSTSGQRPRVLRDAVHTDQVPTEDLPELIAFAWLREDSPTADISEADWLEVFATAGFFYYPPGRRRQPARSPSTAEPGRTGGSGCLGPKLVTSHSYLVVATLGSARRLSMPPLLSLLRYWPTFTAQARAGPW